MGGPTAVSGNTLPSLPYCPAPPPQNQSARENADWWRGVPAEVQAYYVQAQPSAIGGMDGLPAEVRHQANMVTLRHDAANGHDRGGAQNLLDRIERSHGATDPGDRILLLGYQPPGADGNPDAKVIASFGNPDTAENVAIYVPGTTTNLGSVSGGDMDRMAALQAQAEMIPGSGDTSTIVWLGYDAPDNLLTATQAHHATDGAPALRDFTFGLRASHQGPESRTTVIGHSYGATVVGTADAMAGPGLAVNDVIAMGSPGMGYEASERQGWFDSPLVDDISDLHIGKDHFWAGAASNDPVTYTEVHGNSPVDWSFGGQRIATGSASGHSEYWQPDTEALRNQAYILTGNYGQVSTEGRRFG